jgi:uncharacterized lipoprotein YmbA
MWRIIAIALLCCAGCAAPEAAKQPLTLPNADFLLTNADTFFDKAD